LRGYRKNRSDWAVLLVDHHEGYLSWLDYERNQRLIAYNANGKGMMVRGAHRPPAAIVGAGCSLAKTVRRDVGRYKLRPDPEQPRR